jgi:hypothetical protein
LCRQEFVEFRARREAEQPGAAPPGSDGHA